MLPGKHFANQANGETFWETCKCFPVGLIGLGAPGYAQEDLPACHGLIMLPGNIFQISPTGKHSQGPKMFPRWPGRLGQWRMFPRWPDQANGETFPPVAVMARRSLHP